MKKKAHIIKTVIVFITLICLCGSVMAKDYTFHTIEIPGSSESVAYGINNDNIVVGKFLDATGWHGFIYDPSTGLPPVITILDFTDAFETVATGIDDDGNVVGYYRKGSEQKGFYYNGSYAEIEKTGALMTMASDINNNSLISGSYLLGGPYQGLAYIYDAGGTNFLAEFNPGMISTGLGINDTGEAVGSIWRRHPTYGHVGYYRNDTGTEVVEIKYPLSTCFYTDAYDINNDDIILGNFSCYGGTSGHGGFLLNVSQVSDPVETDFDVIVITSPPTIPAPVYWRYYGINDGGYIVGAYMDFFGWHAFMGEP